jgi:hypothetical protein
MRCGRGDVIDNGSNAIIYYRVLSTVIRLVLIKKNTHVIHVFYYQSMVTLTSNNNYFAVSIMKNNSRYGETTLIILIFYSNIWATYDDH